MALSLTPTFLSESTYQGAHGLVQWAPVPAPKVSSLLWGKTRSMLRGKTTVINSASAMWDPKCVHTGWSWKARLTCSALLGSHQVARTPWRSPASDIRRRPRLCPPFIPHTSPRRCRRPRPRSSPHSSQRWSPPLFQQPFPRWHQRSFPPSHQQCHRPYFPRFHQP